MFLIYVDDSGDESRTLFSALAIPSRHWGKCLGNWLGWRKKDLRRSYGLPASYELHAGPWLGKRPEGPPDSGLWPTGLTQLQDKNLPLTDSDGRPVTILSEHRFARRERVRQFEKALNIISGFPGTFLVTVQWEQEADKDILYGHLLGRIEQRLATEGTEGVIFLDGLAPGPHFRRRHREMDIKTRRILEDPIAMASTGNQPMQMADLCAHAAFRYLRNDQADPSRLAYKRLGSIAEPIWSAPRKS